MKLILTGDIHIGRAASKLPGNMAASNDWRAVGAWERVVDLALTEQAAAVLLSGDITDQDNQFWEAIGPLQRGIERLAQAGIRTLAVAGNHDHAVLARLADMLPPEHFTLLGRHGRWERVTLRDAQGQPRLHVDGWSFPSSFVKQSPLKNYMLPSDSAVPILGMIHGDLDVVDSNYAPLASMELTALPPAAWLLGHIHAPRLIPGSSWILYPGSPQALDPGETGMHGPWTVKVDQGRLLKPEQVPASTVWYGLCEVDLTSVDDPDGVEGVIYNHLRHSGQTIVEQAGASLKHILLRVRLMGRTRLARQITSLISSMMDFQLSMGRVELSIEKVDCQVIPAIDLQDQARSATAPGAAARLLLALDSPQPSDEVSTLIQTTQQRLTELARQGVYAGLPDASISEEQAREHLRQQASRLLSHLLESMETMETEV